MIRIHVLNTDGYPFDPLTRKSFFSTIAQLVAHRFVEGFPSEQIVSSHYMVLKDIYQDGALSRGVNAAFPFQLPLKGFDQPVPSITSQCLLVEYPGGEIRAIDFTDKNEDILKLTSLPQFTGAMVMQYDREFLALRSKLLNAGWASVARTVPEKLHPGYYGLRGYYTPESDDARQFLKYVTRENSKLYFRGLRTHPVRNCLSSLARYSDTDIFESLTDAAQYFGEFGAHKIALGLPGRGDLCFRDFEAFALKIPLLRPVYSVTLAEPLLPDFHYLKVNARNVNDPELLAEDIMRRYSEVISDDELLNSITENAYRYFLQHGTYEAVSQRCFEFLQPGGRASVPAAQPIQT